MKRFALMTTKFMLTFKYFSECFVQAYRLAESSITFKNDGFTAMRVASNYTGIRCRAISKGNIACTFQFF